MSVVHDLGQRLRHAIGGGSVPPPGMPLQQAHAGRAQVIAVAAQKGGVGKTTTC